MEEQKRPLPYMDGLQQERAIICPISHYKGASRTTTTNRIKRAQTANK